MLTMAVAASAFAACNKQETTPVVNGLKSVEINIENLVMTKGAADGAIKDGTPVKLNDLRIYLVDGNGKFYPGYSSNGQDAAKSYFSSAEEVTEATTETVSFHYVDRAVTHVIAVGNMGADVFDNEAALKAAVLNIDNQQKAADLKLYAKEQVKLTGTHDDDTWPNDQKVEETQKNEVYTASLTLMPSVARFEVDGFRVKFDVESPKYQNITVNELAFTNYNPTTTLFELNPAGDVVTAVADYTNETAVYQWFVDHKNLATTAAPVWSYYTEDLVFAASEAAKAEDGGLANDFTTAQAFHFFPGKTMPMFLVKLTADGVPAYLYTKNINLDSEAMGAADFKPGYVYRMSAAGEVEDDGSILIDEDDIDPMDRCIDITVSVHKWVVKLVTPEF